MDLGLKGRVAIVAAASKGWAARQLKNLQRKAAK